MLRSLIFKLFILACLSASAQAITLTFDSQGSLQDNYLGGTPATDTYVQDGFTFTVGPGQGFNIPSGGWAGGQAALGNGPG